jgi:hypothetical protein
MRWSWYRRVSGAEIALRVGEIITGLLVIGLALAILEVVFERLLK